MNPSIAIPCALSTVLALAVSSPAAHAEQVERNHMQRAGAYCQGALPAFAGTLRTRPLGVGNEGTETAFVTCNFPRNLNETVISAPINSVTIYFRNKSAVTVTVSCTGVFGHDNSPSYYVKSVNLAPNQYGGPTWTAANTGATYLIGPGNASCALPPGVMMVDTYTKFFEEVGL